MSKILIIDDEKERDGKKQLFEMVKKHYKK